ncbi:Uncharacterised protein [Shigella sonnei]|nr:Uncharacterised protein [Shigella sonnei]
MLVGGGNHFVITDRTARLDYAGHACSGGGINTVAEREERVRSHRGTFHFQAFIGSFNTGDFRGVHAAHLARANPDGHIVFGIDDSVGFHELRHFPAEQRITQFLFGRLTLGDDAQFFRTDHAQVTILNQQTAVHAFEIKTRNTLAPLTAGQNAYVLLGGGDFQGFFAGGRRNNHFDKLTRNDGLCGFRIQLAVKGNDAAECGGWVGFVRAIVSIKNGIADSHAARVGVLHNHTCRLGELFHALQRRIGIGDVVIREGFTLNLGCGSNGGFFHILFYIEGSLLVAVLAVTHILLLNEVQVQRAWEATGGFFAFTVVSRNHAAEVVGNHAVVGGSVFEGFDGEVETGCKRQRSFVVIHLFNNGVVVAALHHDCDIFMVLSGGAHHGRAADIDVLNRIFQRAAFTSNSLGERIQVNNHHIDRLDLMFFHNGIVLAATAQNATMYFRMQGLHASIHHLRETGVIGNFGYRQTFFC